MDKKEFWESLILAIPEGRFFDILRNFLGKIKTPFHKPELIERLYRLMLNEETQDRMIAMVSDEDALIVTAVVFLRNPSPTTLYQLFEGEEERFKLHRRLLSLEYRLLVLTDTNGETPRLRLNPIIKERLIKEVFDISLLFPSDSVIENPGEVLTGGTLPWFTDTFTAALLSFFYQKQNAVKQNGKLTKRCTEDLRSCFPPLFHTGRGEEKIEKAVGSLLVSKLIKLEPPGIEVLWENCGVFAELSAQDRMIRLWSGTIPGGGSISEQLSFLRDLLFFLPPDRLFSEKIMKRMINAFRLRTGVSVPPGMVLNSLVMLGLLRPRGDLFHRTERLWIEKQQTGTVVIEQTMKVTVKPEAPFYAALEIGKNCILQKYDLYTTYELTKEGVNRGLALQPKGDRFIHSLMKGDLSGFLPAVSPTPSDSPSYSPENVPASVSALIKEWIREYGKVDLYDGITVTVDESLRHIVEHTEKAASHITAVPAPGVYVFRRDTYTQWRNALADAGIDQLPPAPPHPQGDNIQPGVENANKTTQLYLELPGRSAARDKKFPVEDTDSREFLFDTFEKRKARYRVRKLIENELSSALTSLDVTDEGKKNVEQWIKNGFVLFPEQLQYFANREQQVMEAKGIDFIGKVRLIEQAIASGKEIVEVISRSPAGVPVRAVVAPVKIDKSGNDLVLIGNQLPGGEEIRLYIRKMSMVRKMESLIGPM